MEIVSVATIEIKCSEQHRHVSNLLYLWHIKVKSKSIWRLCYCNGQFNASTWQGHRMPRDLLKHIWVCLWGCFWNKLAFELVDWVKQMAHPSVGEYPICWESGKNKNKKQRIVEFFSAWPPETSVFSTSFPGSPAYTWQSWHYSAFLTVWTKTTHIKCSIYLQK